MSNTRRRQKRGRNANRAGNPPHSERQQTGPRTTKPVPVTGFSVWVSKAIPVIRGIAAVTHAIVELIRAFRSYKSRRWLPFGWTYLTGSPVH